VDETYVRIKGRRTYLYRAVDSRGQTIDFLLSAKRDAEAAKRFFRKALGQPHTVNPRTITVDKNAAYPKAAAEMKVDGELRWRSRLRQVKYLSNILEQDHRGIKGPTGPGLGFGSFWTARRTLAGFEAMAMIRIGQVRKIDGGLHRRAIRGCPLDLMRRDRGPRSMPDFATEPTTVHADRAGYHDAGRHTSD
jgi:transposase, IS6 family